jgi:hypothetical protein
VDPDPNLFAGSGSVIIMVMDSDPNPKQVMHLIKNHSKIIKKIINLISSTGITLKNTFLQKYWTHNFLLVKEALDPNPDPKL